MEIIYSRSALRALLRSDKRELIRQKIAELAADPEALGPNVIRPNVIRLQGRPEFRLRVQNWRIIFRIEDRMLLIDDIGPRGSVY